MYLKFTLTLKNKMKPEEIDTVIYHNPCSDGTGSGFVAWKYLSQKFPERTVEYYPCNIGSPPPQNLEGKNVLICDYSYKKDVLLELIDKTNKLLIIDHHKSAEKELSDIEEKYKIFDMEHSGAMLTWFYFFPNTEPPLLIKYIEDRDIWAKKLPNTDDFNSWFHTRPLDFEEYDKYLDDSLLLEMITSKGISYGELNNYYTKNAVDYCVPKFCKIKDKYYIVGYVNTTICKSDVGNQIFDKFSYVDFSAAYSVSDVTDSTSFSLRSIDTGVDVSEIARSLDGGGHAKASGVRVPYVTNTLPGQTFDNGKIYDIISNIYCTTLSIPSIATLNIVYLCYQSYKKHLGKYLLQTKYYDGEAAIQVCQDILTKEEHNHVPKKVDAACVFHYDPIMQTTTFSVTFTNDHSQLQAKFDEEFTCLGLHITIPVSPLIDRGLLQN